ncbi:hypothetical protein Esti_004922 [Eimeria stiedai]
MMHCAAEPAAEDTHMDDEPQEDVGWQPGTCDEPPQQQQQQQQQQQHLHPVEAWPSSLIAEQPKETSTLHAYLHASETAASAPKREVPASLEPGPHPNLQGIAHKAEERRPQLEPQCIEQQQQQQQQQPQGTQLAAGPVDVASRVAEKPQHAKSQETGVHKEGGVKGCCPTAANEVPDTQRAPQSREQHVGAQPLKPGMQFNGLALKVLHNSRSSGATGGVCTPACYATACSPHVAGDSHTSTIQKSTAPAAPVLPAPLPAYEGPTFVRYPNMGRGPRPEQQGPQLPQLLQQPSIDLTLQQARLIELDGISLTKRAKPRQPVPQNSGSQQQQQQQQQQRRVQRQQPLLRHAADERQAACSTAAAQQGPLQKWPSRLEAPGHTEDQARRRGPSRQARRPSFEVPRSQAKTQLPSFKQRTHSREFLYQQQQQALLRRMQQQQQRRQANQRRQQRLVQLNDRGGWAGAANARDSPGEQARGCVEAASAFTEAPSWAPQATAAWQQLLAAAAPPPLKTKSFASPAAACYSTSTALELRHPLPDAPNQQQHASCVQVDTWGEQQHMQQQRRSQAKLIYPRPPQGGLPGRLFQPGAPSLPPFFPRDPLNTTHYQGPFMVAPVTGRAAEASSSLGIDPQGCRSMGASSQAQPETLRGSPALVVPPVGCATSYEELIAFFQGLAEQQRPSRQQATGTYHEINLKRQARPIFKTLEHICPPIGTELPPAVDMHLDSSSG